MSVILSERTIILCIYGRIFTHEIWLMFVQTKYYLFYIDQVVLMWDVINDCTNKILFILYRPSCVGVKHGVQKKFLAVNQLWEIDEGKEK